MIRARLLELREIYRLELFDRVIPFWLHHSLDHEHGGQFNSLHRDGSISTPLKGGMWKGFFHIPRALWLCWKLLGEMLT